MILKNHKPLKSSAIWVVCLFLSACGSNMGELKRYVKDVKKSPPGVVSPIPEIKTYASFTYPGAEKDPFDSNVIVAEPVITDDGRKTSKSTVKIDTNRSREFLEGYPLDSLTMVGTLNQKNQVWALIQTSDGTIQRVGVGNYMGKNYGKINKITESSVSLIEKVDDRNGGLIEQPASIAIPERNE